MLTVCELSLSELPRGNGAALLSTAPFAADHAPVYAVSSRLSGAATPLKFTTEEQ